MQRNSIQDIAHIENKSSQNIALLFREHSLKYPLINHILENIGFYLVFFEDVNLQSLITLKPSIIVLDDCLLAATIIQTINDVKTQFDVPVIYLTNGYVRQPEYDQVFLICDDYILKPFTPEELRIRMQCTIRHYGNKTRQKLKTILVERRQKENIESVLKKPYFYIDNTAKCVYIDEKPIHLTPKEFNLFCLLSGKSGLIHSTEEIIDYLWPDNHKATPNDVQQFVYSLRRKIEKKPTKPCFLHNVPGHGYKLEYVPDCA